MSSRPRLPPIDLPGADPTAAAEGPRVDPERAPPGALLLEVAWEVCNQVGGIYTVLRSKAPRMIDRWGSRYLLVGPYVESKAALDFEPRRPTGWLDAVIDSLTVQGLGVYHGRWLVSGRPRVLLLDHRLPRERLDQLKHQIWQNHGIEFPMRKPGEVHDPLIDGVIGFADAVRRLLHAVHHHWTRRARRAGDPAHNGLRATPMRPDGRETDPTAGVGGGGGRRLLVHFHEWLGALAIPMLRHDRVPLAAVFTTHATLLGRYIASGDDRFYERLPRYDHAAEATRFGISHQHHIERACAHGADAFTTVSPITAEECTHLLGRTPELVLPNGLNIDRYNVGHDFQTFHAQFKQRIHRFVMGHFFPSYPFDLDKTLYFFTSGRFEPRNKGFDLCLEAMARLNAELKAADLGVTVVFFIVTQRPTRSFLPQALQSQGILNELHQVCAHITDDLNEKLFRRVAAGQRVKLDSLVEEYWRLRLRRTQHALKTDRLPPLTTHALDDDATDPILTQLRALWMTNRPDDPVKVVYHPDFINPVNPLWGMEYDQFVRGCHLGVFPSAYEPWGYTPLECVAMGVPAVTSDLAGFGRYVADTLPDHDDWGLTVLKRRAQTFHGSAADLARTLLDFCKLDRRGRIRLRNEVERHSWDFDWSSLAKSYDWAHDLAMARAAAGV